MKKSFLIIGAGRFGSQIAIRLNTMHYQVMVAEKDEKRLQDLLPYVTDVRVGDTTDEDFLSTLGIPNFDACFVTIGDDFLSSLKTTFNLKELGAKKVISRASMDDHEKFLLRNGADDVVFPEKDMGDWTAIRYSNEHIFDYVSLGDEENGIFEISAPSEWVGKTIREIDVRNRYQLNVVAIKDGNGIEVITDAEYAIKSDQALLVLGKNEDVQKVLADTSKGD